MVALASVRRHPRPTWLLATLAAGALGAAALGGIQYATAGAGADSSGPPAIGSAPDDVNVVIPNRRLRSTTVVWETEGVSIPPVTYTALHAPVTVTCRARPGTCTISGEMYTEFLPAQSGDSWGTCLFVDGNFTFEPQCPYLDTDATAAFHTRSFVGNQTNVGPGPHTVQTFLYSNTGGTAAIRTYTYRVYTP